VESAQRVCVRMIGAVVDEQRAAPV
jgi:hypothetical protein